MIVNNYDLIYSLLGSLFHKVMENVDNS